MLTSWRWPLLIAAFAMGALYWAPMTPLWSATAQHNDLISTLSATAAPLLQGLGALGMRTHLSAHGVKARWSTVAAFAAAAAWLIALAAGLAAQAAGSAGLVYGLLIMLPAAILAPLLQVASMLGFANAERKGG